VWRGSSRIGNYWIPSTAADVSVCGPPFSPWNTSRIALKLKGFLGAARIAGAAAVLRLRPHASSARNFGIPLQPPRPRGVDHRRVMSPSEGFPLGKGCSAGRTYVVWQNSVRSNKYNMCINIPPNCVRLRRRFCFASYLFVAHVGHNNVVTTV